MPVYEYEITEGDCRICRGKLTLRRPLDAPELTKCPLCKKPVRKLVSGFNTPELTKPLSVSDAKKAGFKIYKKTGSGEYEKQ
jgi:putative FmdB family regulatory protein